MSNTNKTQQERENAEPYEGSNPIPIVVLTIIAGLLIWAVYYLATSYHPQPAYTGDDRIVADFAIPTTVDGSKIYGANCVACHQATGAGIPGVFPPLSKSEWVDAEDPGVMIRIVLHGVTGELTVEGQKYNGEMPHFGESFSDAEVAAVVNYVRTNFDNSASETDADYVAKIREESKDQTEPWNGDADLRQFLEN